MSKICDTCGEWGKHACLADRKPVQISEDDQFQYRLELEDLTMEFIAEFKADEKNVTQP